MTSRIRVLGALAMACGIALAPLPAAWADTLPEVQVGWGGGLTGYPDVPASATSNWGMQLAFRPIEALEIDYLSRFEPMINYYTGPGGVLRNSLGVSWRPGFAPRLALGLTAGFTTSEELYYVNIGDSIGYVGGTHYFYYMSPRVAYDVQLLPWLFLRPSLDVGISRDPALDSLNAEVDLMVSSGSYVAPASETPRAFRGSVSLSVGSMATYDWGHFAASLGAHVTYEPWNHILIGAFFLAPELSVDPSFAFGGIELGYVQYADQTGLEAAFGVGMGHSMTYGLYIDNAPKFVPRLGYFAGLAHHWCLGAEVQAPLLWPFFVVGEGLLRYRF